MRKNIYYWSYSPLLVSNWKIKTKISSISYKKHFHYHKLGENMIILVQIKYLYPTQTITNTTPLNTRNYSF